ncbi:Protein kinase-like domain containing protein [Rhypophila decipiens]
MARLVARVRRALQQPAGRISHPYTQRQLSIAVEKQRASHKHPDKQRVQNANHVPVAVKEIFGKDADEMFKKEIDTLLKMRQFNNPHLIKHIAACRAESDPPIRCIIFPFASGGDPCAYWDSGDTQPRTAELVQWSLQQMHGLATAVHDLHGGFPDDPRSNVRHGDLKPQNILIFEDPGEEKRLVIADVGIAKVHMGPTAVRTQKATGTFATTRSYEAPEAHPDTKKRDERRSRTYDVWSLGCIFLEFTIWLLFNVRAVNDFAAHRPKIWTGYDGPGGFYEISPEGIPSVCKEVQRALADLLDDDRCGEDTAMGQLVRLISRKMLVAEVAGRCDAEKLVESLKCILDGSRDKGKDYFLKPSGRRVVTPEMFCPVRRGSSSNSITK